MVACLGLEPRNPRVKVVCVTYFTNRHFSLAGATRIELISKVLETFILPIELSTYLNGATSPTRTENLRFTRALHCHCANVAYGGQYRIQTDDLLCARQAFYQLN